MIVIVGTNHKISPIKVREKISFLKRKLNYALASMLDYRRIKAGIILSTCNRVELYADVFEPETAISSLKKFISDYHQIDLSNIEPYLYTYIGKEAIVHLFCVSCGIDSQIIGETQILEQVRSAFRQAKEMETTDILLNTVFEKAIETSLKVRQRTEISKGKVSLASIAIELIKEKFGDIKDKNILIIGAGKISELVVKYLKKEGLNMIFVANRTFEKALQLAGQINASVIRFDKLKEKLKETDVVISATSSPHIIIKKNDLSGIKRPLLIIDLAVPRDVEGQVQDLDNVSLFNLDDLDFIIERNLDRRRCAVPLAFEIVKKEADNLWSELLEWELEGAGLP